MIVVNNDRAAGLLREAKEAGDACRMARAESTVVRPEHEELKNGALRTGGFAGGGVTAAVLGGAWLPRAQGHPAR